MGKTYIFEQMARAGLTAANCTVAVWEGFVATMSNIASFKRWLSKNAAISYVRCIQHLTSMPLSVRLVLASSSASKM